MTLVLVHGGLWEDGMDAERFWTEPGVTDALRERGLAVYTPDRLPRPPGWQAEVAHLERLLPGGSFTLLAGSNGCSAAVRLALVHPGRVAKLILAWPATCGDADVDRRTCTALTAQGASEATIEALLAGQTLRGVTDAELAGLRLPVAVAPSIPNPFHQRRTAEALLALIPGVVELAPPTPEPPRPEFPAHLEAFVSAVLAFA
ncbi:alpha/beta fold hydrolase [Planomonospora corallina]|uniref:Alpha/beta fold hydrolase n=1 Tax=Planomonospora corallina TaxID=1806052 RepID=A0ABV8I442_9ACTN